MRRSWRRCWKQGWKEYARTLVVIGLLLLLSLGTAGCSMWPLNEHRPGASTSGRGEDPAQTEGLEEKTEMDNKEKQELDKNQTESATSAPDTDAAEAAAFTGVIRVDASTTRQTMDGFGTSGCWWAQEVGTWEEPVRNQVTRWLFDQEDGIGLTLYRFNVGAGDVNEAKDPWRRVETFETAPGVYDWTRDAGSVTMLRMAVAAGVQEVVFFANSPPGRMLQNGRTTGDDRGESNLIPGMESDFARYLLDIAQHFAEKGIPVRHISPVNEPQWNWKLENGQEGCHYTPDGVLAVGRALLEELAKRGNPFDASLADSGKMFDEAYTIGLYETLATDAAFAGKLPHFAAHAYWSSELDKKLLAAKLRDLGNPLPLWQSEWCQMEGGSDFGMDPALVLARCVHEDLTILDCTSWQTWIAVTRYDYKDGLIHADTGNQTVTDMKRLWALGNWSRFVRPGSVRVDVPEMPQGLLASAWKRPDGSLAVVVVNESQTDLLTELHGIGSPSEAWETSDKHNLERVGSDLNNGYAFPARSITTLLVK